MANWTSLTAAMHRLGVRNTNGTPLRKANVRLTWARVVRDKAAQRGEPPRPAQPARMHDPHALYLPPDEPGEPPPQARQEWRASALTSYAVAFC